MLSEQFFLVFTKPIYIYIYMQHCKMDYTNQFSRIRFNICESINAWYKAPPLECYCKGFLNNFMIFILAAFTVLFTLRRLNVLPLLKSLVGQRRGLVRTSTVLFATTASILQPNARRENLKAFKFGRSWRSLLKEVWLVRLHLALVVLDAQVSPKPSFPLSNQPCRFQSLVNRY